MEDAAIPPLLDALARALGDDALRRAMRAWLGDAPPPSLRAAPPSSARAAAPAIAPEGSAASGRFLLQDILDDSILGAKTGDKSFPLRVLFSELATRVSEPKEEVAFTLLCALNVFFRVDADDEVKMRLGHEISRLYYRFMDEARPEGLAPVQVSGLVAALLSTELSRVRLEAVDHAASFDSQLHERAPGADPASSAVRRPASFLCRVTGTGMVRIKAGVLT